jgi:hypothetical protein
MQTTIGIEQNVAHSNKYDQKEDHRMKKHPNTTLRSKPLTILPELCEACLQELHE